MERITIHHNFFGLDLGQRRDHTALAVVAAVSVTIGRDPVTYNFVRRDEYRIVHLERFDIGMPYTRLPSILRRRIAEASRSAHSTLAVDATGPGLPVVDLLRGSALKASLLPVMITGAGGGSSKGVYTIARKALLTTLRVAIETGQLKAGARLHMRDELAAELRNLEAESGSDAREHDDLVFAVALALWAATIRNPSALNAA